MNQPPDFWGWIAMGVFVFLSMTGFGIAWRLIVGTKVAENTDKSGEDAS